MLFGEFAAGESPGKQKTAHARQLAPLSVGLAVGDGGGGGVATAAKSSTAIWPVGFDLVYICWHWHYWTSGCHPPPLALLMHFTPFADTRVLFCLLCGCLI